MHDVVRWRNVILGLGVVYLALVAAKLMLASPWKAPPLGPYVRMRWKVSTIEGAPLADAAVKATIHEDSGIRESQAPRKRKLDIRTDPNGFFEIDGPMYFGSLIISKPGFVEKKYSLMPPEDFVENLELCMVRDVTLPPKDDLDALGHRKLWSSARAPKRGKPGDRISMNFETGRLAKGDSQGADLVMDLEESRMVFSFPRGQAAIQPCMDEHLVNSEEVTRVAPDEGYQSRLELPQLGDHERSRTGMIALRNNHGGYVQALIAWSWLSFHHGSMEIDISYARSRDRYFMTSSGVP